MEDSYLVIQDLGLDPNIACSYFAVFDGHGGDSCSLCLKRHLHKNLVESFVKPKSIDKLPLMQSLDFEAALKDAVYEAYETTDLMYQKEYPQISKQCGSTAVVCLIIGT